MNKLKLIIPIFMLANTPILAELGPPDLTTPPPSPQAPAWVDNQIQQPWVNNNTGPTPGTIPEHIDIPDHFGGVIPGFENHIFIPEGANNHPYHDEL